MKLEASIGKSLSGDRGEFAEIVRQFQRPLFSFLARMGLDRPVSEDIAQETFVRAWINLGRYDPAVSRFSTWLFTIARNLALSELDRAEKRPEARETLPDIACEQPGPHEKLDLSRSMSRLRHALSGLSQADRSILALAYVEDMTLSEIAKIEGCTKVAAKVRIHRAKMKLRILMEKENG